MSRSEVLKIKIPEGLLIPRLYLYSFLNFVEVRKIEVGEYLMLEGKDLLGAFLDGLNLVKEVLEKRRRNESTVRLSELPMSGDDKKIFAKLCSELRCNLDPIEILGAYIEVLKSPKSGGIERLRKGLGEFDVDKSGYSLPSIFKLEIYRLTRGAFFKDGFSIGPRVSSDFFLLMLAGYLLSRVGRTRLDERSWLSVHILPLELAWSKVLWRELLTVLSERWYGIRPADALILHLLVSLWNLIGKELNDFMVLGISDPAGSAPATVSVSMAVPLKEVYTRAKDVLDHLLKENWSREALRHLVRRALSIGHSGREIAEKFVKLIFLSIQGDVRALEELSLTSSRLEARISAMKKLENAEHELLAISRDARKVAGSLLNYYFSFSQKP